MMGGGESFGNQGPVGTPLAHIHTVTPPPPHTQCIIWPVRAALEMTP